MIQARTTLHVVGKGGAYLALTMYALLSVYPFIWMASAAFKNYEEVFKNPSPIPWNPTLSTLTETWSKLHFFNYFFNSVKISFLAVAGILMIYSMAAYAFAYLDFPGRNGIFTFYLSMMLVPGITVMLPLMILERKLGILGTHAGVYLALINGTGPFAVFLLRNYFMQLPRELHDAARVDGANEWQIYWRVYLRLAKPALVSVAVINFLAAWNAYVLPSIVLNDESLFTLPLGMQNLMITGVTRWNEVMAGALITVLPVIVVFLALQKHYVAGLAGSVKG